LISVIRPLLASSVTVPSPASSRSRFKLTPLKEISPSLPDWTEVAVNWPSEEIDIEPSLLPTVNKSIAPVLSRMISPVPESLKLTLLTAVSRSRPEAELEIS